MKYIFYLSISMVVAFGFKKNDTKAGKSDILYIETNNFEDNKNAVLAYRDKGDGKLEPLEGSPFLTNGAGVGNSQQILGPLDSDYELRVSSDGKFLLAVNSGSNTIAIFLIKSNGALEPVAGSPFPSGGKTPVSIDVSGNHVFVVNKSQDPLHSVFEAPNYSAFTIDAAGKLTQVSDGKFETAKGSSPSNVLVSHDGKFLFGTDFLGAMLAPPVGTLRSFAISNPGTLTPAEGTPYVVPGPKGTALGLWQHPSANVLYAGNPLQGKVNVYAVNATNGALALQTSIPAGKAACWIRTTKDGKRMYVLNSGDNTVTIYNSSNALSPILIQTLELKNSGPSYTNPDGIQLKTSQDFSMAFSTSEKKLYVVCQHTNKDFSIGNYNYLHTLAVADNGQLTETANPIQLPVANTIRPKGSAVVSR
jgi:6-phosphogluconolactonase (cycloisomerase 2 family)